MKPSDRTILTYLRKCNCQHFNDSEWAMVEDAVEKAGDIRNVTGTAQTIIFDAIKKATFSSRSEAGRYAANMRWKGQGERTAGAKGRKAELAAKYPGVTSVVDLPPPGGERSAEQSARIAANVKRLREQAKGFDSPKMKEQLAYEAKRDATLGDSAANIADSVSEEAEAKQAFIDAQKGRLANMGRGTSQVASMALAAGIKQLESELASGDTSEARGKPGQFFDDRSGSKGPKYIGRRPNKVVAQDIRTDLKAAQASGELPTDLKFSVKMDARGSAIRVRIAGVKNIRVRDDLGRDVTTPEAKAIYDKVDRITNAYNRNNSDIMTDYFDTDYYGFVNLEG